MSPVPDPRSSTARSQDPSLATLLDWVEGRLASETADRVAAAVASDPTLTETVEWIRQFHAVAATMPLESPPPEVSARLHAAFDRLHDPRSAGSWSEASPDPVRSLPHAAGFRSAGRTDVAHLQFRTRIGDLLLRVSPAGPGLVDITGRVLLARTWDERTDDEVLETTRLDGLEIAALARGTLRAATRCESVRATFELLGVPDDADEIWVTHGTERVLAPVDLRLDE